MVSTTFIFPMRTINLPLFGSRLVGEGGHFGCLISGLASDGTEDYGIVVSEREVGELEGMVWSDGDPWQQIAAVGDDGFANTAAMASAGLQLPRLASTASADGHSDFYIPSALELRALQAMVPHLFSKAYHWSSTALEGTPDAWSVCMQRGLMLPVPKGERRRVRLVRRISLSRFVIAPSVAGITIH